MKNVAIVDWRWKTISTIFTCVASVPISITTKHTMLSHRVFVLGYTNTAYAEGRMSDNILLFMKTLRLFEIVIWHLIGSHMALALFCCCAGVDFFYYYCWLFFQWRQQAPSIPLYYTHSDEHYCTFAVCVRVRVCVFFFLGCCSMFVHLFTPTPYRFFPIHPPTDGKSHEDWNKITTHHQCECETGKKSAERERSVGRHTTA